MLYCRSTNAKQGASRSQETACLCAAMKKLRVALCVVPLLLATVLPVSAQRQDGYNRGMREGGRGGNYYHDDRRHGQHHDRDRHDPGGIGAGYGAAIGGAGEQR